MKNECATCGGSGQVGSFLGVSRFLITWDECPACFGTGYVNQQDKNSGKRKKSKKSKSPKKKGKG